jgi:tellurite resistance protein TerC
VLVFIGAKMLLTDVWHVPTVLSLGVIVASLGTAVLASHLADAQRLQASAPGSKLSGRR